MGLLGLGLSTAMELRERILRSLGAEEEWLERGDGAATLHGDGRGGVLIGGERSGDALSDEAAVAKFVAYYGPATEEGGRA